MMQPSSLLKFPLFSGFSEEQIENILPLMTEEEFDPDDIIITEGKTNDKVYFILKGKVTITRKNAFLACFCEGESFGEMEVLDVMLSSASVKALSHVIAKSLSNRALRAIYNIDVKTFSLIILNIARELTKRVRKMDEQLASLSR